MCKLTCFFKMLREYCEGVCEKWFGLGIRVVVFLLLADIWEKVKEVGVRKGVWILNWGSMCGGCGIVEKIRRIDGFG